MLRLARLAVIFISSTVAVSAIAEAGVHHLDEYTSAAARRYPGMKAAEADIDAAQAQLNEAKLSPWFQFEGQIVGFVRPGAQGTPIFSPDSQLPLSNKWGPGVDLQLQGGIPIYTFGKYRAGTSAAKAGISAAEHAKDRTLARVIFDVRRAYYGTQLALDLQSLINEGKGKLEKAVSKLAEQLEDDDPSVEQTDYYRLVSALSDVKGRESEAMRLESSARAALELLSGIKPAIVPECSLEPVTSEILELSEHIAEAEENRPELGQLKAAESAQKARLKNERAGYFPDIILAVTARYARTPVVTDIDNPFISAAANSRNLAAGLVARWKLDFAGSSARVKRAKAEIESLKSKTEEAKLGIAVEVSALYEQMQDAKRRNDSWLRAEKETRKWFITAAQGYEVGTTDANELVDALDKYFESRSKRLMAVAEYNIAIAGLEKTTGVPLVDEMGWRPQQCE
jgi:outer membrane protein TolC